MTLAVGVVIDDAIVVLENVYAKIEAGMRPVDAGIEGTKEIFFAVIATTLALVAVLLPILFIGGLTGRHVLGQLVPRSVTGCHDALGHGGAVRARVAEEGGLGHVVAVQEGRLHHADVDLQGLELGACAFLVHQLHHADLEVVGAAQRGLSGGAQGGQQHAHEERHHTPGCPFRRDCRAARVLLLHPLSIGSGSSRDCDVGSQGPNPEEFRRVVRDESTAPR